MPPVTPFMIIVPCAAVILVPALLFHAALKRYWLACGLTALSGTVVGWVTSAIVGFPMDDFVFGLIAGSVSFVVAAMVGIPFAVVRRSRDFRNKSSQE